VAALAFYHMSGLDIRRYSFIIYTKREGIKVCLEISISGTFIPFLFVRFCVLHNMPACTPFVRRAAKRKNVDEENEKEIYEKLS